MRNLSQVDYPWCQFRFLGVSIRRLQPFMRFCQIDQITLLEPGKRIEARRSVQGNEDYLRDHFPRFAVMPGVLMLEALFQASALLVRASEDDRPGLVLLRTVKNVKFADFVQPGETLNIKSELFKRDENRFIMKAEGRKGDSLAVSGRLVLECVDEDVPEIVNQHASMYMRQLTEQLQQAAMACQ